LNRKKQSQLNFVFSRNSIPKKTPPDQFKTNSRERYAPAAQLAAPMEVPHWEES
jgi:hypothetical protein